MMLKVAAIFGVVLFSLAGGWPVTIAGLVFYATRS